MNKYRTWLGNKLFKLADDLYLPGNSARKNMGNFFFGLAAKVSPDKPKKTTRKK